MSYSDAANPESAIVAECCSGEGLRDMAIATIVGVVDSGSGSGAGMERVCGEFAYRENCERPLWGKSIRRAYDKLLYGPFVSQQS